MARSQSPGYPQFGLPKALQGVQKIFSQDRTNPIDRVTATKHLGYSGSSGAADKALATLIHFGLVERVGKGEVRVSQRAIDIIHPDQPSDRKSALLEAAFSPHIFKELRDRFGDHVSETALQSYLVRQNFLDRAIGPVSKAYFDTCRFLEQEEAFESRGNVHLGGADSESPEHDGDIVYGGAKVGDLIQWEINGQLQMEKPMRVRMVTEDGQWVAVDGSETGIPMNQVIVEERGAVSPPPTFKIPAGLPAEEKPRTGEAEWISNLVGRETKVRLLVSGGEMGGKEIGRLIKLLEAQKAVLDDEDDPDDL